MAVDTSIIGKPTNAARVTIERGPVSAFAHAVLDDSPVYHDAGAAEAAGFAAISAPPTFTFAMQHQGRFAEQQPADPTGGVNPMHSVMGDLYARGALVLHGEQEFTYHRPIVVGDTLVGEAVITDAYEKESETAHMTFIVISTEWRDDANGEPVVTEQFNLIARLRK